MHIDLVDIIKQLKKVPTTIISDSMEALGLKHGWLYGLAHQFGLKKGTYVGQVRTLQFAPNIIENTNLPSFYEVIRHERNETILLISGAGEEDTILGDNYALAAKKSGYEAIIVDGAVRDTSTLNDVGIGIFSVGCEGSHGDSELVAHDIPIMFRNRWIVPGDIVAADNDGAIIFPAAWAEAILRHAQTIVELERELREVIENEGAISDIKDIFRRKNNPIKD